VLAEELAALHAQLTAREPGSASSTPAAPVSTAAPVTPVFEGLHRRRDQSPVVPAPETPAPEVAQLGASADARRLEALLHAEFADYRPEPVKPEPAPPAPETSEELSHLGERATVERFDPAEESSVTTDAPRRTSANRRLLRFNSPALDVAATELSEPDPLPVSDGVVGRGTTASSDAPQSEDFFLGAKRRRSVFARLLARRGS
jgi:hypothetical protein